MGLGKRRVEDAPPVFFAPRRLPAPFLGPLARPWIPWVACRTVTRKGGGGVWKDGLGWGEWRSCGRLSVRDHLDKFNAALRGT